MADAWQFKLAPKCGLYWLTLAVNGLSKIPRLNIIGIAVQIPYLASGVKTEIRIAK